MSSLAFKPQTTANFFERHPKSSLWLINGVILAVVFLAFQIKWIREDAKLEAISLKTALLQKYYGHIIDRNVGRFIKLKEHKPSTLKYERPSRDYMSHIAKGSIERKYYRLETDHHGFIMGPELHHENPDYEIVFLGGSTTECLYVDEDKRFPYVVRKQLEARLGKKVNTYNGGVSANESQHSLNSLMNKVLPLKPFMVVLMHNINDLVMLRLQGDYFYPDSRISHVQSSKNVFSPITYPKIQKTFSDVELKKQFTANLRSFIALCRIRDTIPVLMTQANRVMDDPLYHEFNEVIRQVALSEKVQLIDLARVVPSTEEYLYDSYHYTKQGSLFAADTIVRTLFES